jgi:hypothetical protein
MANRKFVCVCGFDTDNSDCAFDHVELHVPYDVNRDLETTEDRMHDTMPGVLAALWPNLYEDGF